MSLIEKADAFLWVEKYRPASINDIIMPARLREECEGYIKDGQIPHMLLSGSAGIGKTTVAKALINMIDADMLYINASNESGVDTIRTKIVQFASTASFEGSLKVVLLDESDQLSHQAQGILRAVMEEFHQNTRFILTCNFKNKIMDAIHSRCVAIDFTTSQDEREQLMAKAFKRSLEILKTENIEVDKPAVASIVQRYFPDMRRVLNALQKASAGGKLTAMSISESIPTDALYDAMKSKKFNDVRKWVAQNSEDYQSVFRDIYDRLLELFSGPSIPQVVVTLDLYQDRMTRTADNEITMMACLTEIMATVEWK